MWLVLNKEGIIFQFYEVEFIKSFGQCGYFQAAEGAFESYFGYVCFALAGVVAEDSIGQGALKIITYDRIMFVFCECDVFLSFYTAYVGIVHDEAHAGAKTGMEENIFAIPGVQQVKGYSGM